MMGKRKGKFRSKSKRQCNRWTKHSTNAEGEADDSEQEAHTSQDAADSDIPGYYFDPEKKTYFKILPNHLSCSGRFVTKDTIKKSKNDSSHQHIKRQKTTSNFTSLSVQFPSKRHSNGTNNSMMSSLFSFQNGQISGQKFEHCIMYQKYSRLYPNSSWGTSEVVLPNFGVHLEALQRMELSSKRDKAVCVWSVEMDMSQKIQLMSITYDKKSKVLCEDRGCFPVKLQPSPSYGVTCSSKISSLCWCPLSSYPGKMCVLYTTIFPLGDFNSKVSISNLQAKEREEVNVFDFSLGRGAVWSSAWNRVNNRFSVGCERKCQVIDVHARRQWVYSTCNSDALAQVFSGRNPHLLYSGTRSGIILLHDLRSHGHSQISTKLNQKMPVVCLRSPKDDNYIYASDFSGLICKWDLRMQKIITKYSGLVNSHYQLPFYLDETEQFIYGTGSNGYCKLWDQTSSNTVNTIAPPVPDIQQDCLPMFPITHFSRQWTGQDGIVGAITGIGRKFFLSN